MGCSHFHLRNAPRKMMKTLCGKAKTTFSDPRDEYFWGVGMGSWCYSKESTTITDPPRFPGLSVSL